MMDLVKKNLVSIISGVVALLAVGAIFWPVSGYFDDLRQRSADRANVYGSLNTLLNKQRQWPNVSLDDTTEARPLKEYPTKAIIDKGKELVDQIKKESGTMYETAWKEFNKREELVPGALPDGSTSNKSRFVTVYTQAVDMTKPAQRMESPLIKILKAGFRPHAEEINARKAAERADVDSHAQRDGTGNITNREQLDTEYRAREALVPLMLNREVAQKSLMYLFEEKSLDAHTPITTAAPGTIPDPAHVWIAQVSYWIQEDVFKALASVNEGATNVRDAPVKQLYKISIATNAASAFKPAAVGAQIPPSGNPDATKKPEPNYISSITGRVANPLYDVVPFNLQIIVDATRVQNVLQALSRNRFITVTTCSIDSEDISYQEALGFEMGDKPIVKLNMNCEALLFREWTIPLMPPSVRRGRGLPETDTAAQ